MDGRAGSGATGRGDHLGPLQDLEAPTPSDAPAVADAPRGSSRTGGAAPSTAPEAAPGWLLPLVVVVVGMFMSVLNTTSVNVALTSMASDIGASTDDIDWVVTAYNLALGVVVPLSAWLGERLGLKRLYSGLLLGFVVASALCAPGRRPRDDDRLPDPAGDPGRHAPGHLHDGALPDRAAGQDRHGDGHVRVGHGRRAGDRPDPRRLPRRVRRLAAHLLRSTCPSACSVLAAAVVVLPTLPATGRRSFDLSASSASAGACSRILLAVSKGSNWGWTGYRVLILLTAGALLLALFVVVELEVDQPLLDVRVFRILAVHQLARADRPAVDRAVRGLVLRPDLPAGRPSSSRRSTPASSWCPRRSS